MKTRIIIAIVITILLGSFSLVNYLSKDKDSSKESEVVKSIRNENYAPTFLYLLFLIFSAALIP